MTVHDTVFIKEYTLPTGLDFCSTMLWFTPPLYGTHKNAFVHDIVTGTPLILWCIYKKSFPLYVTISILVVQAKCEVDISSIWLHESCSVIIFFNVCLKPLAPFKSFIQGLIS